ncbi:hypothetical protein [Candidatus Magnetobacterium casense]|uniref:Uncharacterized protein n=1 Tax=Candidatus Magnetobacterium casense TaxID=1455061 RepID=A0ABS6S0G7_9BACT|nr:hypothetical protein [Candidatus Magnetobacterium casensis]MBV6342342.1 hypothetical protein [Candidatus Magnetobacterium casensis]
MEKVYEKQEGEVLVEIFTYESPESPREWDNLGTMVCWHRRYSLGDKHDFKTPEEFKEWAGKGLAVILPIYLYDHSGLTVSTQPFSCPWDSGQVGWIYATKEDVRQNYGVKKISAKWLEHVKAVLEAEVKTYDQYLNGEVYGYKVSKIRKCEACGHEEEIDEDSCWGFYGEMKESGILENLPDFVKTELEA